MGNGSTVTGVVGNSGCKNPMVVVVSATQTVLVDEGCSCIDVVVVCNWVDVVWGKEEEVVVDDVVVV